MQMRPNSSQAINLADYVQVLAKRTGMILKLCMATAVLTAGYSLLQPNIYSATALLIPAQEEKGLAAALTSQLGGLANLAGGSVGGATIADLYVSMLKSETIKDPIIDRFKLLEIYDRKFRADAYAVLGQNSSISAGKKDNIITITVDDPDPKRAAAIANAYLDELHKLTIRLNIAGAGENRAFLEERLVGAKADLAVAEDALKTFQMKYKAVQVPEQARATITGIAELKALLAAREVELSTISRSLTDYTPEVRNLKTSIANLKGQIYKLESGTGGGAIPGLGSVPEMGQEYVRLMRNFKAQETMVELLTKQYEMARLSEKKDVAPLQVLQTAKVPEIKSRPARAKLVLMATFSMGFFAIILSFLLEYLARMPEDEKQRWTEVRRDLPFFRGKGRKI